MRRWRRRPHVLHRYSWVLSHVWRSLHRRRILRWRRRLRRLLLLLELCKMLLSDVEARGGKWATAETSEDDWDQVRRNRALVSVAKHSLLEPALLELQLLLAAPVVLDLGGQPDAHRVLGAMPLRGRGGQRGQLLRGRRPRGIRQADGAGRRKAAERIRRHVHAR